MVKFCHFLTLVNWLINNICNVFDSQNKLLHSNIKLKIWTILPCYRCPFLYIIIPYNMNSGIPDEILKVYGNLELGHTREHRSLFCCCCQGDQNLLWQLCGQRCSSSSMPMLIHPTFAYSAKNKRVSVSGGTPVIHFKMSAPQPCWKKASPFGYSVVPLLVFATQRYN